MRRNHPLDCIAGGAVCESFGKLKGYAKSGSILHLMRTAPEFSIAVPGAAHRLLTKAMLRSQSAGGWQFERLMQRTRARLAQPTIPAPPLPTGRPPPAPELHETERLSVLGIVNAGRAAKNLPLLTERDLIAGPEQPKPLKIDRQAVVAMILEAERWKR